MKIPSKAYRAQWISELYTYIFCLLLGRYLVQSPVIGGALYMCGHLSGSCLFGFSPVLQNRLGKRNARIMRASLIVLLVLNLAMLWLTPSGVTIVGLWTLFFVILSITCGEWFGQRQITLFTHKKLSKHSFFMRYFSLRIAFALLGLLLLTLTNSGWTAALGFVLCCTLDQYVQLQSLRQSPHFPPAEEDSPLDVDDVHALREWGWIRALVISALQISVILMYTLLISTAEQMMVAMVMAAMVTLCESQLTRWIMRLNFKRKQYDSVNHLLVGLFLWLYSIFLFSRLVRQGKIDSMVVYFVLTLASVGSAIAFSCLDRIDDVMEKAARFALGSRMENRFRFVQLLDTNLAMLISQTLVLAALTILSILNIPSPWLNAGRFSLQFQPVMIMPTVLLLLITFLIALRFPMNNRYIRKLDRMLHLQQEGKTNPALQSQLQSVLVHRHHRPLGTQIIITLLRPLFHHKIVHGEKIIRDESNPVVYLCNHSEFYGPVACILYLPVTIRPWSMSQLVMDPQEMAQYVHKFTISQWKWMPEKLRMPFARLLGPISIWLMNQVESIPVFRNTPTRLMKTMRMSLEAMEAGDSLLIFPENPDAPETTAGYATQGIGPLFSGFAMLSQLYYKKTGKICRYIPMYASKKKRTLSFGDPILYNPDNTDEAAERERISAEAYAAISALYHEAEDK